MEKGLLVKERLWKRGVGWRDIWEEMKRLGYIAGPMVAVTLSFFLLSAVSLMLVGHLGELALSSTAIAISFAGVTGFSLLVNIPSLLFFLFALIIISVLLLPSNYVIRFSVYYFRMLIFVLLEIFLLLVSFYYCLNWDR